VTLWSSAGDDRLKAAVASASLSALRQSAALATRANESEAEEAEEARGQPAADHESVEAALGVAERAMAHAAAGVGGPTTDERVLEGLVTAVQLAVDEAARAAQHSDTLAPRCAFDPSTSPRWSRPARVRSFSSPTTAPPLGSIQWKEAAGVGGAAHTPSRVECPPVRASAYLERPSRRALSGRERVCGGAARRSCGGRFWRTGAREATTMTPRRRGCWARWLASSRRCASTGWRRWRRRCGSRVVC
jgi:hypothetical protein